MSTHFLQISHLRQDDFGDSGLMPAPSLCSPQPDFPALTVVATPDFSQAAASPSPPGFPDNLGFPKERLALRDPQGFQDFPQKHDYLKSALRSHKEDPDETFARA